MVLRGVVAQQAVEPCGRQVALAEERVRALEGAQLPGKLGILYITAQDAGRHVLPEGDGVAVDALVPPAVDDVVGQKLHHVQPRRAAEVAAAAKARIDLKEHIAARAAVVLHVDV